MSTLESVHTVYTLWHFPVISFIHSYFIDGQLPTYVYIMDIVITVLLAELSFRYVETPLRKEGLKAFTFKKLTNLSLLEQL